VSKSLPHFAFSRPRARQARHGSGRRSRRVRRSPDRPRVIGGTDYDPAIRVIRDLFAWAIELAARDLKPSPEGLPPEMSAACRPLAPTTPPRLDRFASAFKLAARDLERSPEGQPPEMSAVCRPLAPTTPPQSDLFAGAFELAACDLERSPESQPPEMSAACRALKLAARDLKRSLESQPPEMSATCSPLAPTTPPRSKPADVCERCGQPAPRFPIAA